MKPILTKPMTPHLTLRRLGVLLVALLAGCAISACGSAGSTATSGQGQHAGDGSGTGTAPVPVSAFPTPVIHRGTGLLGSGQSSSAKVPLVIALHGGGGATPALFENATGLDQVANQHNLVVAYLGSPLPLWKNPSDITYIGNMIKQLESSENIDPNRVYVVGFSLGGYATFRSACELSSQVAGVAIVSSAMAPLAHKPCPVTRPVSELSIVGTNDLFPVHKSSSSPISADATASMWRTLDGCSSSSSTSQVGPTTQTTWSKCNGGAEVGEYVVSGGTHRWPGSPGSVGADGQYNADTAIWSFLSKHSASSAKISAAVSSLRVTRGHSRQVRLVLNPIAESSAVLLMVLSAHGRKLASKRITLHGGRRSTSILNVPRRAKAGRDPLVLNFVDSYGHRQTIVRTVTIPALPSSHHSGKHS